MGGLRSRFGDWPAEVLKGDGGWLGSAAYAGVEGVERVELVRGEVESLQQPVEVLGHEVGDPDRTHLPVGQEPSVPSSELDRYVAQSFLPRFGTSTGSYFKGRTDVRIVQLLGDSTTFGYNAWIDGPIDLVFIDGAHDYRTKKIDSENALRLLSPTGVILWDNFADVCCPEVTRYLLDLSADRINLELVRAGIAVPTPEGRG